MIRAKPGDRCANVYVAPFVAPFLEHRALPGSGFGALAAQSTGGLESVGDVPQVQ